MERCHLSDTMKSWKVTSLCSEMPSCTECSLHTRRVLIFMTRSGIKKFFTLNPHVGNEERLQRGSSFRECQAQKTGEGPDVPQQLAHHGL